jgi:hypothetical protein
MLGALLLAALPQGDPEVVPPAAIPAEVGGPEARALWQRVCAAARVGAGPHEAITAFEIEADVRTREGVQRNDMRVEYRFLAPDCIRFQLPSGRETGKASGSEQRSYWLRDGEERVSLVGRENAEDRRLVDEMLSIATNFVALSDPARVRLARLETADGPPAWLGGVLAREAKPLAWLELSSPDFALVQADSRRAPAALFTARLGVDATSGLPAMVILSAEDPEQPPSTALPPDARLIRLGDYRESDGFRIPYRLLVHRIDAAKFRPDFAADAAQEIYVQQARLRPALTTADFAP